MKSLKFGYCESGGNLKEIQKLAVHQCQKYRPIIVIGLIRATSLQYKEQGYKASNYQISEMAADTASTSTNTDFLNLKVKAQDGEEVFFKIKKTTLFKKLMDAYCQRQNLNGSNVRFLFDGQRIHENQTPKEVLDILNQLNMENGDQIDVVVEQIGGAI